MTLEQKRHLGTRSLPLMRKAKRLYSQMRNAGEEKEYHLSNEVHDLVDRACKIFGENCDGKLHIKIFEFVFGEREEPPIT